MAIMDKLGALLPWRGEREDRREAPAARGDLGMLGSATWVPPADVHETDDELVVTAEVPGLEREDLDLTITPSSLIIRGEKRACDEGPAKGITVTPEGLILRVDPGRKGARKDVYLAECHYGSFVRTVPLTPGLAVDRAEAQLRQGVLSVRFPKVASRPDSRHIPIRRG